MKNEEIIQASFHDVNINNASSGLRENTILTNFSAQILVGNMAPKLQSGRWGGTRGNTYELCILTTGCEMEVGGGGEGGTPVEHTE